MKIQHILLSSSFFVLLSCATENTSKSSDNSKLMSSINYDKIIKKPYNNVNLDSELIVVDTQKDSLYKLDKGGHIYVPANSFVHLSGEMVSGSVEISIEKYTSLSDIILSGIPMKYDSAGIEYDFTSAGMYNISGKKDNEPIAIAPQKSIEVGITSYIEDSPCFNFYQLNENGNWNYLSTEEATHNPDFPKDLIIPEEPKVIQGEELVFDLNIQKMSKYDNSELQFFLWQYDGLNSDTIDKAILSNINYKNLELIKTTKSQWSYDLKLKDKNKTVTIPVKPAFTEENIEAAMQEYKKALKTIEANQAAADAIEQGNFLRVSSIQNFGIYNYDRVINDPERIKVSATFDVGKEYSNEFITVYLISREQNAVISYGSYTFDKFSFNPVHNNILVATLPNNEVAVMDTKTFKNNTSLGKTNAIHFKLNLLDQLVTNSKELDDLIESL